MSAHPPSVPPDQRSGAEQRAGNASGGAASPKTHHRDDGHSAQDPNLAEQGRQAAIKQNTTNKGYQQDR